MANLGGFRREDAPEDEFDPIPAGTYQVIISETGMHPYKSGGGEMLKLVYEVVSEPQKGRKVFDYMNLWHPTSEKAKKIAWAQMGKILDAAGKLSVDDSAELENIVMTVDIEIDGDNNRIKKWHPATVKGQQNPNQAPASAAENSNPAASQPVTTGKTKAPWEQ